MLRLYSNKLFALIVLLTVGHIAAESSVEASHQVSRAKHQEFADRLTENLYENDNECSSTWGVSMLFDLLRPGASEDTAMELCDILGLCNTHVQLRGRRANAEGLLWNDTVERVITKYQGGCLYGEESESTLCEGGTQPTVKVANSVWVDTGEMMVPGYLDVVGDFVTQIDFDDPLAARTVNNWINASTLGLIDSVLEEGPIPGDLCAVNSIYLNAAWANVFSPEKTNEDNFYTNPTRAIAQTEKAHFMHMVSYLGYTADVIPGVQLIEVPYQSRQGGLYMTIILPLVGYVGKVSSSEVETAHHQLTSRAVAVALPKFQFQSLYDPVPLRSALEACGLMAPFSLEPGKGFCGMLMNKCLMISDILQKTSITVDEQGTVAAAVSVVMTRVEPTLDDPILFLADHPFQFFICDSDEDLCFFEGRVGAPGIPPGSLAPLASIHTEEDFWLKHFGFNVSVEEGIGTPNSTGTNSTATNTTETNTTTTTTNSQIDTSSSAAVSISFVASILLATLTTSVWF